MWVVGILFMIALWEGAKAGWKYMNEQERKSRAAKTGKTAGKSRARKTASAAHHATGYWASEAAHGFPQFRHGFAGGWHEARTRHDHALARRESSAADRAEARREALRDVREHRKRRQSAERVIKAESQPEVTDWPPLRAVEPPPRGRRHSPGWEDAPVIPPPSGIGRNASPPTDAPGRTAQDTPIGAPGSRQDGETEPATTKGSAPVAGADATYTEVHQQAEQDHREAVEDLNRIRSRRRLTRIADMLVSLGVKAQTLSTAADYDEALAEQEKAAEKAESSSSALIQALESEHGGIQQAADDAPIAQPAQPEFYGR